MSDISEGSSSLREARVLAALSSIRASSLSYLVNKDRSIDAYMIPCGMMVSDSLKNIDVVTWSKD